MAYFSGFLAIFLVALLALANISQGGYDHHPDDHVRSNYFQDRFLARAFGFKRSLKQNDASLSSPKIVSVDDFRAKGNGTDGTQVRRTCINRTCLIINWFVNRKSIVVTTYSYTYIGFCESVGRDVFVAGFGELGGAEKHVSPQAHHFQGSLQVRSN